jgi:hypothetical protein
MLCSICFSTCSTCRRTSPASSPAEDLWPEATAPDIRDAPVGIARTQPAFRDGPAVQEVAIVGMPHEQWGEAPHAFVVLKPGGAAVVVFSHPCFPQGGATVSEDGGEVCYRWDFPYFEERKCVDPPWGHFKTDFLWFHRPLSDYWKAFMAAGFVVVDFEEPRITADRYHLAKNARQLKNSQTRPNSVAFKLLKTQKAV